MPNRLVDLTVEEVSGVDRPANKRKWLVVKRADSTSAETTPDPPSAFDPVPRDVIKEETYRAPMPDDLLAARDMREQWSRVHSAFLESFDGIMYGCDPAEQPALLQEAVKQFAAQAKSILPQVRKALPDAVQDAIDDVLDHSEGVLTASRKLSDRRMRTLKAATEALQEKMQASELAHALVQEEEPMNDAIKQGYDAQVAALTKRVEASDTENGTLKGELATLQHQVDTLKAQVEKTSEPETEPDDAAIWKGVSPMLRKKFEDQMTLNKHLEEAVKIEKDRRERQEFIEIVKSFTHLPMNPDDDWVTLRDISSLPEKSAARIMSLLRVANDLGKSSRAFVEVGHSQVHTGEGQEAGNRFMQLVNNAMTKGEAKTIDEAMVLINKMHPGMYAQYAQDQQRRARAGE